MEIIVFFLYLIGLFWIVFRSNFFTVEGVKKPLLVSFWGLKLIAGICFYVVFSGYSLHKDTSISREIFESSEKLYWLNQREPALFINIMTGTNSNSNEYIAETTRISDKWYKESENNIFNDNRIIIRFNTLLQFISFRFYSVHILFMCFLSFIGAILLFKAFPKRGKKEVYAATIACFLAPSLVFWSVGVLKEPLLLLGLGGYLFYFKKSFMEEFSLMSLILFLLCTILLASIKIYILAIVLPMSLVYFYCYKKRRFMALKYIAMLAVLGGLFFITHFCFPQKSIDIVNMISAKNQELATIAMANNTAPAFQIPHLDGSPESVVKNIPLALFNSLTQPFACPTKSLLKIFANIETVVLILLLIICVIFGNYKRFLRDNFAIFSIIVCLYGFILIGLITPDTGMIMRYKSLFLPFYIFALIHLLDTNKILYLFKIRKRKKKNFDPIKDFEERIAQMTKR